MTVKMAVIGAGRIGQIHATNAAQNPGVQLVGIADAIPAAAQQLASALGTKLISVEQIFSDASIDAVLIGASTDTHADLIQRSAAAGKHIFCEKPVDLDLARARECEKAVQAVIVPVVLSKSKSSSSKPLLSTITAASPLGRTAAVHPAAASVV